jgi:hypothetical protein
MKWITTRISAKIVVAMIVVLTIIMAISAVLIVNRGSELLRDELLVKASSLAKVGATAMEGVLEEAIASGRFTEAQIFDTNYREIKEGLLAGAAIPKYHTAYDEYLDNHIKYFQDTFLLSDQMVVFAVLVDRNGYLPTHNTRYSQPLTGDPEKDRNGNRTKRIFNDPTGLAAAKYDGKDGVGYLRQIYQRDTGEVMWDISAPVYVQGKHWGGFRIGFSIVKTEATIAEMR